MYSNSSRVSSHTAKAFNDKIRQQTEHNITYYAAHPEEINVRLQELDKEWDIERTLEAQAATVSLVSVVLGTLFNRKLLFLPAVVGSFLLQHAISGWCPPLPVFRRFGIRTQTEIERERYALKALRGDFNKICNIDKKADISGLPEDILEAVDKDAELGVSTFKKK